MILLFIFSLLENKKRTNENGQQSVTSAYASKQQFSHRNNDCGLLSYTRFDNKLGCLYFLQPGESRVLLRRNPPGG